MQAESRGEDECKAEHGPCVGDLPEEQKPERRTFSNLSSDFNSRPAAPARPAPARPTAAPATSGENDINDIDAIFSIFKK